MLREREAGLGRLWITIARMAQRMPGLDHAGTKEVIEDDGIKEALGGKRAHELTAGTQACRDCVGFAYNLLGSREVVKDLGGDRVVHVVEKERRALADKVETGEAAFVRKERPECLGLAHGSQKVNAQAKKPASHVLIGTT